MRASIAIVLFFAVATIALPVSTIKKFRDVDSVSMTEWDDKEWNDYAESEKGDKRDVDSVSMTEWDDKEWNDYAESEKSDKRDIDFASADN